MKRRTLLALLDQARAELVATRADLADALVAQEALTVQRDVAVAARDEVHASCPIASHADLLARSIALAHRLEQAEARSAAAVEREVVLAAELARVGIDPAGVLLIVDAAGAA